MQKNRWQVCSEYLCRPTRGNLLRAPISRRWRLPVPTVKWWTRTGNVDLHQPAQHTSRPVTLHPGPCLVHWCIGCMRLTWAAFGKESAVPIVATPASTTAPVHPLASRRSPRVFSRPTAISIWSLPKKMTEWSFPCVSGHLHWICLESV